MSVAADGGGGLAYLKQVGGVNHVLASPLIGGSFVPPVQLDSGLAGPSSQPVTAAGRGGLLAVAFINNGGLYVVTKPSTVAPFSAPRLLAAGASNPAISASAFGKAYIAFTVGANTASNVRSAYYSGSGWANVPGPLDGSANDGAGTGTSRPSVITAGDGTAIVAWGEAGHILARRVRGLSPSAVTSRLDAPTVGGQPVSRADEPVVGAGGDSSYADVAFHATVGTQSRVLMTRLIANLPQPTVAVDALGSPPPAGADDPGIALSEYGRGFITSTRTDTSNIAAVHVTSNGAPDATISPVNPNPEASAPYAAPGIAGLISTQIAYQYDPGPLGSPDIRLRYALNGVNLGPEQVLSNAASGPADAADGLATSGDGRGDAAVAWVQGAAGSRSIVVDQLYWPPGGFTTSGPTGYIRSQSPTLGWNPATVQWGPIHYTVAIDGQPIATTGATSLAVPFGLLDGPHSFSVYGTDPAGARTATAGGSFFVDHLAPVVSLRIAGTLQVGVHIHAVGAVSDTAPPEVPGGSSGITLTAINFGDGTAYTKVTSKYHAYTKAKRYRITFTAEDRAGNVGLISKVVTIKVKPKPKRHSKTKTVRR